MTQLILDVTCGTRSMWFDRDHPEVVYGDYRRETLVFSDRSHCSTDGKRTLIINPQVRLDFRRLPFRDETFYLIVFDPPHLKQAGPRSWMAGRYGKLQESWRVDLANGFRECFRVLRPHGTLVFKWAETQVKLSEILELLPMKPLFGNRAGRKAGTHWLVFLKPQTNEFPSPADAAIKKDQLDEA